MFLTILVVVILDQASKFVVQHMMEVGQSIAVIDSIFHFTYILNSGAAFGLLANRTLFFVVTTVIVVVGLLIYSYRSKKGGLQSLALGLLLGGAVGNLLDRLRFGHVVDFIDFRIWPVFNIADIAIVLGSILLIYALLMQDREKSEEKVDSHGS